jgi:Ca2+-transporting ATPase
MAEQVLWNELDIKDVFAELKTSENGLSEQEARKRLEKYGLNELVEKRKISRLGIFLRQFKSLLIIILIIAAVLSFFIESIIDSVVILAIVILNGVIGYIQEYKAEKAMEALKKLTLPSIFVLRDGRKKKIEKKFLVLGDMVLLEEGDKAPADIRLTEVTELEVDEAVLTGESLPVIKQTSVFKNAQIGEQKNMVFMGTAVDSGRGRGIVVRTGMNTEMGKIAEMIQTAEEKTTPLQQKLDKFGKNLGIMILVICAIVAFVGIFRGNPVLQMVITSIALAVAAIPEGLPAVVTITLAFGLKKMAKKNAMVRKLTTVETLGCVTAICADKTGTLTRNEMFVSDIFCDNRNIKITGSGYEPRGEFFADNNKISPEKDETLCLLLKTGSLCNNADLQKHDDEWRVLGDPTEGALLSLGAKVLDIEKIQKENKRLREIPFTSARKMMSTLNYSEGEQQVFVKGAAEIILDSCSRICKRGKITRMTSEDKKIILSENKKMADNALRVLGFAWKKLGKEKDMESNLVFIGLAGMIDVPREGVKEDIAICRKAGIKVVMITGDHKDTAVAIAKQLDLIKNDEEKVLVGSDLDKMSDDELKKTVLDVSVYARVNPEHKVRILNALKRHGHIVAMTGDGVNDAPALKNSDIGVAMGIKGTDVAKEASDMILSDDHFSTIVSAVKEGRRIYDNILKFVLYLLSSNIGEILIVFIAIMIGLPLPLVAVQLLWINLVTDALPAVALGSEPVEKYIMERKPRNPKERILGKDMLITMIIVGIIICAGTLAVFYWALMQGGYVYATTMAFTTVVIFEMFNVLNCKSMTRSVLNAGIFSNKKLIYAIISSVILQAIVIYIPVLDIAFDTVPLTLTDWIIITSVSFTVIIFVEIKKSIVSKFYAKTGDRLIE